MPNQFQQRWHQGQQAVDAALEAALAQHATHAPPRLVEAMRYSLLSPGKRLRPLLCLLACESAGGDDAQAMPAACALEMVHCYSLIHDDLPAMDDDDLRRGQLTCHRKFDEATAILAGDALLTMAFAVLAAGCPPRTAAVSCLELAQGAGANGMVGGQMLDLHSAQDLAMNDLAMIHRAKTGALIRSSLRLGVYAARAEEGNFQQFLPPIDQFAETFGLLFQITDDLLDATGTEARTGKRVGKDAARGKLTYPGVLGIDGARAQAAALAQQAQNAANSLGTAGRTLAELAQYVLTRDR